MKHIIDGEYAHHSCDFCGAKKTGTQWTTYGPGWDAESRWQEDSSAPPTGWTFISRKTGKYSERLHRCIKCTESNCADPIHLDSVLLS